ncbi:MAG: DUF2726 domain-containing protein [Natronohydrobacter sp.]|nr:DUF2726 domain-containing protein [Natronohydrobacter sp.]
MDIFRIVVDALSNPMALIGLAVLIALLAIMNIKLDLRDLARNSGAVRKTSQPDALGDIPFERQSLMNKTEFRVFATVEKVLTRNNSGYRVMAQTSLGEVLRTGRPASDAAARKAYGVINSKRLDIAVIDRAGYLALAIEVQGSGHYQDPAIFIRDAVKKEALRRAGVDLLEVMPDWETAKISQEVSQRLKLSLAA